MFSFFKKKEEKKHDDTPPIPNALQQNSDDFIMLDPKDQPRPSGGIYPSTNIYGQPAPYPGYPPSPMRPPLTREHTLVVHYLDGVPFKLSSSISTEDSTEITRIQINEVLGYLERACQIGDYDFNLEKSLTAIDG